MIANHDDSVIADYRGVAEAVHRHDCRTMSQLTDMGRRSQSDVEGWHVLLSPSQIPEKVHRKVPHEECIDRIYQGKPVTCIQNPGTGRKTELDEPPSTFSTAAAASS